MAQVVYDVSKDFSAFKTPGTTYSLTQYNIPENLKF